MWFSRCWVPGCDTVAHFVTMPAFSYHHLIQTGNRTFFTFSSQSLRTQTGGQWCGQHLWNVTVVPVSPVGKTIPSIWSPHVTMPTSTTHTYPSPSLNGSEGVLVLVVSLWCGNRLSFRVEVKG